MTLDTAKPLALIVGVGGATGSAVCTELAANYRLAMVARSSIVIKSLAENFSQAIAYTCDVTNRETWISTLNTIKSEMGLPDYILINTEGGGWGDYTQIAVTDFSNSFEVNVVSLLTLVQTLFPNSASQAPCRIVINSSPAAYVSHPLFLGIAPSRAAQRVLAETLDAAMIHVDFSILSIDGAIDETNMRNVYSKKPDEFFIKPATIANQVRILFEQAVLDRSVTIRALGNSDGIQLS
jgi:NADP-dependent 3-hydroxy acid dehydrogenase YdfG